MPINPALPQNVCSAAAAGFTGGVLVSAAVRWTAWTPCASGTGRPCWTAPMPPVPVPG